MTKASINDALAVDPIQIGRRADVVAEGTGIGVDVIVENRNGVAIGRDAQSLGADATAIGTETRAPSNWNTVIGYQAGSAQNGENVVAIGRKAEVEGNNGVAVGESARANADDVVAVGRDSAALEADATALGRNATANATGAIAIGQGTTNAAPNSVGIGDRDYSVADGRGLLYPAGTGPQTLVSKPVDGSLNAGDPVGYDLEVGGTTVASVFAESDGAGGVQNARLDVPVSLAVDGSTTEVDNVVTGRFAVEDGSEVTQFLFDATGATVSADFGENTVENVGDLSFDPVTGAPTFTGHDHSEGGLTDVPNAGLANDTVTVSSGNALTGGGSVSLGGSTTLGVASGSVGSTELANDSVTVSAGLGLTSGGTVALGGSTTLDHANTTSEGDLTAGAGAAIDSVSLDQFGHVTGLSTESFDSRYDDYSSWTFEEGDGESTTVTSGERAIINGGGQINTELVSTSPPQININHNNTTSEGDLTAGAGAAIDSVSIDGNGHVTGLSSEDFDGRYVLESGDTMSDELKISGKGGNDNSLTVSGHIDMNGNDVADNPVIRMGDADSFRLFDGDERLKVNNGGDVRIGNGDGSGDLLELRDGDAGGGAVRARFREFGQLDIESELTENAAL